jgi:Uma2 family endonuclease
MPAFVLGNNEVVMPAWVIDQESFLRWACSDEYPRRGRFAYYNDQIWVDLDMEAEDHNLLKTIFGGVLAMWAVSQSLGRYYGDRMILTNAAVGLSTEPDGMFVSSASRRSGRVVVSGGRPELGKGVLIQGAPDMVLEVVSLSSVHKDTVDLPDLYWRAGIPEYWLVDPRGDEPRFTLYSRTGRGYRAVRPADGWRRSSVFGAAFRLAQTTDDLGLPAYMLERR